MERPKKVMVINLTELEKLLESYLDFVASNKVNEDECADYAHYIFEEALTTYYGKDVFKYINEKVHGG